MLYIIVYLCNGSDFLKLMEIDVRQTRRRQQQQQEQKLNGCNQFYLGEFAYFLNHSCPFEKWIGGQNWTRWTTKKKTPVKSDINLDSWWGTSSKLMYHL